MPDNNFKLRSKGFSLLELLISITLVALVTAVAIPNLRQLSKDQEVNNAASQLVNILRRAQASAASRIQCLPTNVSSNWQVVLNTSGANDNYSLNCFGSSPATLYPVYNSPFAATPTSSTTFQAIIVPACPAGDNMTIYFTNQQTTYQCTSFPLPLPVPVGNITITLSNSTSTKSVVIEQGGSIR